MSLSPNVVTVDISLQAPPKSVYEILLDALYDKHYNIRITYNELVLLCLEHNLDVNTVITIFDLKLKDTNK